MASAMAAMATTRGRLRLSPALAMVLVLVTDLAMLATDLAMAVMAWAMPSGRGRLRLSPALAMVATDSAMAVTVLATDMPSGRGRLRLSPALAMVLVSAMAAMDMASGRGPLAATAMVDTAAMVATVADPSLIHGGYAAYAAAPVTTVVAAAPVVRTAV